jgi:hypothetical protein
MSDGNALLVYHRYYQGTVRGGTGQSDLLLCTEARRLFLSYLKRLCRDPPPTHLKVLRQILIWFNAAKDIRSIPFDFVLETSLAPILLNIFLNTKLSCEELCDLVRIMQYLTYLPDQIPQCFLNAAFFDRIFSVCFESNSESLICHSLILISQLLLGFEKVESSFDLSNLVTHVKIR